MKRIYTVTLEDGDYPSNDVEYHMKELAYLLYDKIDSLNYNNNDILYKKGLIYNQLFETGNGKQIKYIFKSEKHEYDLHMYEPFIIGNKTFGFTVNDGKIDAGMIHVLLEHILKMMNIDYKFSIDDTMTYDNDRDRIKVIRDISKKSMFNMDKVNKHTKIKFSPLLMGIIGR